MDSSLLTFPAILHAPLAIVEPIPSAHVQDVKNGLVRKLAHIRFPPSLAQEEGSSSVLKTVSKLGLNLGIPELVHRPVRQTADEFSPVAPGISPAPDRILTETYGGNVGPSRQYAQFVVFIALVGTPIVRVVIDNGLIARERRMNVEGPHFSWSEADGLVKDKLCVIPARTGFVNLFVQLGPGAGFERDPVLPLVVDVVMPRRGNPRMPCKRIQGAIATIPFIIRVLVADPYGEGSEATTDCHRLDNQVIYGKKIFAFDGEHDST